MSVHNAAGVSWYHTRPEEAERHNGCLNCEARQGGRSISAPIIVTPKHWREEGKVWSMTGTTHKIGGVCAGAIALDILELPLISPHGALLMAGAVLGSLLPDIDHPGSAASHKLRPAAAVYRLGQGLVRSLSGILPGSVGNTVRSLSGHRGITHSLLLPISLSAALFFSGGAVATGLIGTLAGVISHIGLDMLSGGVPLLLPFSSKRLILARIRTGGMAEAAVRVIFAAAGMAMLYSLLK